MPTKKQNKKTTNTAVKKATAKKPASKRSKKRTTGTKTAASQAKEFEKVQTIAFFMLLIGVGLLFYSMIQPYVYALFWAGVIAALLHPIYRWLHARLKHESVSAGVTIFLFIVAILGPLSGVFGIMVDQAIDTYDTLNNPSTIRWIETTVDTVLQTPLIADTVGDIDISQQLEKLSSTIASISLRWLQAGSSTALVAVIQILVMLYSLYYFLIDGPEWLRRAMHLLPFGDDNERILYEKFVSTSKATLKGTLLLGALQGILGGLLFFFVGIPSAAFWGLVMIVFAIIPAIGSFIVWFPGMIYLLIIGQYTQAIIVLLGGTFIGLIDNLLRPPLVGKDIEMHPMLILFSTIGGLVVFGMSGVVIGPMVAAFFAAVLHMYEQKYKKQLDNNKS